PRQSPGAPGPSSRRARTSPPGVRQLLRKLLGGYWGFNLEDSQQLQPPINNQYSEIKSAELFGQVRGGIIIRDNVTSQPVAVWDTKANSVAVLTTERSTFLGWRWGTDSAASAKLDRAWLTAALKRYLQIPTGGMSTNIPGGEAKCSQTVTRESKPPQPTIKPAAVTSTPQVTTAPIFSPGQNLPKNNQEAIDQLENTVKLDIIPNSSAPISQQEAIALQKELENLVGRVESANLTAAATTNYLPNQSQSVKQELTKTNNQNLEETLTQARELAKNIPALVAQKNYASVRQQWLKTKANLWQQFPINQHLAQPEIRAVWLDRGTIVRARNEEGLAKIFDRLAKAGINTVFLETVNASYPIYPSQVAPQQNPLIPDWNPLASAVKLAHARGMELHAWVWTFAAGNQRHNQLLNLDKNYLGPVLAAHPDWANYDNKGNIIPIGQNKPFLDPANPEVRKYLLQLFAEIVTQYQVDGLHLDYIRYPFQDPFVGRTYGYGKAAREQFQQQTGVDPLIISPSQRELWSKWTEFRTAQIDSFVAEVAKMTRQQRPNLILSVAVFPLPEYERVQKLQQHWEVWARQGDIDLIVPMTYALDTPRFQRLAQPWIDSKKLGATLLVPGIRLLSLPSMGAFDQLQLVRDLPTVGYALFAAENLNEELDQILATTQGKRQNAITQPIPQRQPFYTAAVRYQSLQKEWQFVQQNGQLPIPKDAFTNFQQQAKDLQIALNQLATVPSASNLITARAALNRLQLQFRKTISLAAVENPYLVKVWENRLLTIERLLRYGERRVNLVP
ncbi:MAG TPA: family 10 glycosylhydrolase, partial [Nostocaceae cyanobacterium]|nr:family 10 glycosylhydrolase [Nostocaceae cyanobacterium]